MSFDSKSLNALIGKIKKASKAHRENIQAALVGCAYFATFHRNTTPAKQLFEAVGGETYKAGMSKWLSTYAAVYFKNGEVLLADKRQKEMSATMSVEEFSTVLAEAPAWYEIDSENNKTPNVWETSSFVTKVDEYMLAAIAKLRKHDTAVAEAMDRAHNLMRAELAKVCEVVEK